VNYAGVMPIIFAQSILMFPQPIFKNGWRICFQTPFCRTFFRRTVAMQLGYGSALSDIYSLMILFFSYFWVATQFNEIQIADDLKKNGGYIPGVRPGQGTSDYLHKAMSRITLAGAFF
jgi:preprotein translocase subunit SecY